VNVYQEYLFHTKMVLKDFDLDNYLFGLGKDDYSAREAKRIAKLLKHEMMEIFYGKNMSRSS
ncbi:MAG: S-adenosylmethionine decarboxylase, partial [Thioalkalivibrio sp.]|nr:S-adenosylmethionine decarboxylase [Thioalkalivibrio sp.]